MTQPTTDRFRQALDWAFRDRGTGRITIAQWPNLPLWLFIVLTALSWMPIAAGDVLGWIRIAADIALAWWAGDELARGVNPWRRLLGAATLLGLAALIVSRTLV